MLLCFVFSAAPLEAQQWTADVYAGGTRYDAIAARAGAANVVGNLRAEASRIFGYVSAALPVNRDAPTWGALGGGLRLGYPVAAGAGLGLDIDADGYLFRYSGTDTGGGLALHVLPHVALTRGALHFQLQGGRHDHRADGYAGNRHLYEVGMRAAAGDVARFVIADVRVLGRGDERYPMARVQLATTVRDIRIRGMAGRWFGDDMSGTIWGADAAVAIGSRGELWAGVRRDAGDPLYLSVARTTWNVGYSLRLGRQVATSALAPDVRRGTLILRLPRTDDGAAPAVAGEFSDWQPLPMQRSGDDWIIEISPGPGVYRFAFVAPDGEWFVPEGYPGRMDDDMGGHVAVVVVP